MDHTMANAKKTAASAAEIEETFDAGFKAAESAVKTNSDACKKGYETLVAMSREAFDNASKAGAEVKGFDQAVALPKANFEAIVEAGQVVVKGVEEINGRVIESARSQFAEGVATQKAMFGAKTLQEAMQIHQDFVKKSFDRVINDGVELSSAWVKVATEAAQPINQRVSSAVSEFSPKA
ncbi:MAG: phasin family protein [Proteobacteria bacterium]|nr:phasin family protein [Pseudomonadota bacterium]